jgi:thiamine biosynthesis lipoprotein
MEKPAQKKDRIFLAILVGCIALLLGIALWQTRATPAKRIVMERRPEGIMGTSCQLVVVIYPGEEALAEKALQEAESLIRSIESRMSNWIEHSEVQQFNRSEVGTVTYLSPETATVIAFAKTIHTTSRGAFDITVSPLIQLWKAAGKSGVMPTPAQIKQVRKASEWSHLSLENNALTKTQSTLAIDLGGIAKGFAIDLALERMRRAGVLGALVDIGGDLRASGLSPEKEHWGIDLRDPFSAGIRGRLPINDKAVCTSGNYARYVEIQGRRFSHIIDPVSGYPVDKVPSVTVIGPDAMTADCWATALSVLGSQGLEMLPDNLDAYLIHEDGSVSISRMWQDHWGSALIPQN